MDVDNNIKTDFTLVVTSCIFGDRNAYPRWPKAGMLVVNISKSGEDNEKLKKDFVTIFNVPSNNEKKKLLPFSFNEFYHEFAVFAQILESCILKK